MSGDRLGESIGAVIVAAGSGTRFGQRDKVFEHLDGRPVLQHSLDLFDHGLQFDEVILVLGEHTLEQGRDLLDRLGMGRIHVCVGGATRSESVRAGLAMLSADIQLVAIHDAARPLVTVGLVQRLVETAQQEGAAVPGLPLTDTVHMVDDSGHLVDLVDRNRLRAVQTPQVARRHWIVEAYRVTGDATDESSLLFQAGYPVAVVPGDPGNLKLTWQSDLHIAEAVLSAREVLE